MIVFSIIAGILRPLTFAACREDQTLAQHEQVVQKSTPPGPVSVIRDSTDTTNKSSEMLQSNGSFAHDRHWPLDRLPFDVWSEIVSYIGRHDLAQLCIVSSTFLSVFRPTLYRRLVFDYRCNWVLTMDLLARDKALASAVVELHFLHARESDPQRRVTLNMEAIANLTSLRLFRFAGPIFGSDAEETRFWRFFASKIRTPLEQLIFFPIFHYPRPQHRKLEGIGGLKAVEWNIWLFEDLDPLWSVLSGSLQTLTSLTLPALVFGTHEYPHFANLRFPTLRVLVICSCHAKTSPALGTHVTNFVVNHDRIEELRITPPVHLDAAQLNANSLPRIRVFKGHPSQFNLMMSTQIASLSTTLRRLTVIPYSSVEIDSMFSIIQSSRGDATILAPCSPTMLQHIEFSTLAMSVPHLEQIISSCAESFGYTLEVLNVVIRWIDLESGLVSALASLLEPFQALRVVKFTVDIDTYSSPFPPPSEHRAETLRFALPFARSLFEHCATLREVQLRKFTMEHSWLVTRTPESRGEHCPSNDCTGHLLHVPTNNIHQSRPHPLQRGLQMLCTTGDATANDS